LLPCPCLSLRQEETGQPRAEDSKLEKRKKQKEGAAQQANRLMDAAGVSLGPIGLTIGSELKNTSLDEEDGGSGGSGEPSGRPTSYASLTTEEWRALYEKDGYVDLWLEEEFNAGSRLVVRAAGRARGPGSWGKVGCGPGQTASRRGMQGRLQCHGVDAGSSAFAGLHCGNGCWVFR